MEPYVFKQGHWRLRLEDTHWIIEQARSYKGKITWSPFGYYTSLRSVTQAIVRLVASRTDAPLPEALKEGLRAAERLQQAIPEVL